MRLFAQLNFGGNCEEAFRFYEEHLGQLRDRFGVLWSITHERPRP
jgi:uncharacterized glyoxalase superfamily protein PhnB